ncbi:MAG: hypothetical protein AB2L11_00080 [Syntrophobacteraceae bacterium]
MRDRMAAGTLFLVGFFLTGCGSVHYQVSENLASDEALLYASAHDEHSERILNLKKDLKSLSSDIV